MKAKYFFVGLLVFFYYISLVKAQDTILVNPAKIDSLQQLIDSRPKADEEKVRLMNEFAQLCFYNQEYLNGFIAARDARELSKKLNFKGGEIMYYLTLAAFHSNGDMFPYHLQQALSIVQKDSTLSSYFTNLNIPDDYPPNNDLHLLNKLKPTIQYFENLGDKEIQLTVMYPMGYCYLSTGSINELKILIDKGIQLSIDINQNYPLYLMYQAKIYLAGSEGNMAESKKIENEFIEILSKNKDKNSQGLINLTLGKSSEQFALAVDYYLKSAEAFESTGDLNNLLTIYYNLGGIYSKLDMDAKVLEMNEKRISLSKKLNDRNSLGSAFLSQSGTLYKLKRYDEARKYMALALQSSSGWDNLKTMARSDILEGQILMDEEKYSDAIPYFQKGYEAYLKLDDFSTQWSIFSPLILMAECYLRIGDPKNALKYALESYKKEYENFEKRAGTRGEINYLISEIYIEMGQPEKAFDYLKTYLALTADANKTENANKVAEAEIRTVIDKNEAQLNELEKERIQKIQQSKIQRVWIFSITSAFLSALLVAFILYRNNKNKQKANAQLKSQKEKVELTLEQLKSTQSQLIQSEKMASLGELTAGIAHEIQNPLNFVNNFSEVNAELIEEAGEEIDKGNIVEVKAILNDIKENEQKINHHGKRADAIVKGMLQHSRTSSGQKELTDINALADEYLRLAYHGMKAKDKSFNADFKTEFDESLPKINVIPQDIGRVLLNLINNAFYALAPPPPPAGGGTKNDQIEYRPTVIVRTSSWNPPSGGRGASISVSDNGSGIPAAIIDKIFQPFFTTKPTGSGTGLGLSLSYDIVKAHGGTINVESLSAEEAGKENQGLPGEQTGTEFIITIPFNG